MTQESSLTVDFEPSKARYYQDGLIFLSIHYTEDQVDIDRATKNASYYLPNYKPSSPSWVVSFLLGPSTRRID